MNNDEIIKTKQSNDSFISKKKIKLWNILLICIIGLITLGGSITAIYFSIANCNLSSQYGKSYRTSINTNELDPANKSEWFENPAIDTTNQTIGWNSLQEKAPNNIKNAYSRFLSSNKIDNFDVSCGINNDTHVLNLNATLPNKKYIDTNDDSKKKDQSLNNILINDVNSSRISLVYAYYGSYSSGVTYSSIMTPEEYVNNPNLIQYSNDSKNVYVHIDGEKVGQKILDSLKKPDSSDADSGDASSPKSEIYIIRDINGLINRMVNDIEVSFYYHNGSGAFFDEFKDEFYNAYWGMSLADRTFGDDITSFYNYNFENIKGFIESSPGWAKFGNFVTGASPNDLPLTNKNTINGGWFYRLIDGDFDDRDKDEGENRGTIKEAYKDMMSKYVMGVVTSDKVSTFLPSKDPTSHNKNKASNNEWLVMGDNDQAKASLIYRSFKQFQFDVPEENLLSNQISNQTFKNVNDLDEEWNRSNNSQEVWKNAGVFGLIENKMIAQSSSFTKSAFSLSPVLASLIGLVVVILLVGIIIGVLYRIPWLFAFGCILVTLSLTLLIMIFGGYVLSLGLLTGLLSIFICSMSVICLFMKRLKKHLNDGMTPLIGLKKVIKNTILQGLDIHFVTLIISICFILIGRLDLNTMGVCISVGMLLSMLFILCIWPFICWMLYTKQFNINWIISLKKTKNQQANTSGLPQLMQSTFDSNNWKFKLNIFNNTWKIIIGAVSLLFILIGVILLSSNANKFVGSLFANGAINDYFLRSFYAWLISIGLISIYGLIRLNWTTFIPLLATLILGALIPFMLIVVIHSSANQIGSNFAVAFSLGYLASANLIIIVSGNLNNSWIKTHLLTKKNLKEVINFELKNNLIYVLEVSGISIGSILVLLLFSSTSVAYVYLIALIFVVVNLILVYSLLPWLLYYFIWWRYQLIGSGQRKLDGSYEKMNYDDIDEQEITEINKFKKVKATI